MSLMAAKDRGEGAKSSPSSQTWMAPEAVGFSAEGLARIQPIIERYCAKGRIPGAAVTLARGNHVFFKAAAGVRNLENGDAMEMDTLVALCSMTKPITSLALLQIVERGQINLDEPVDRYLPELKNRRVYRGQRGGRAIFEDASRPITVHDLLTHSAGLGYGAPIPGVAPNPVEELYQQADLVWHFGSKPGSPTLEEMMKRLRDLPLHSDPGERWIYSVANDVQARLIEVLADEPFDSYLKRHILTPLDMPDTAFTVEEKDRLRRATMYQESPQGLVELPLSHCQQFEPGHTFPSGGGGLISTVADYLRFAQMLLAGGEMEGVRIVSPNTVALMTQGYQAFDGWAESAYPGYRYGYGVAVLPHADQPACPREYYWPGAANTSFWVDPAADFVGVIATQVLYGTSNLIPEIKAAAYAARI